ncbi:hypothetical protein LCGC14_0141310 [marine sediment metagenome]|uniref:Uncharacterized protein n=1 Tax=marine sediment metagenome TaxID=412755 RepID=A0A0F9V0Z4_9ZZZZ
MWCSREKRQKRKRAIREKALKNLSSEQFGELAGYLYKEGLIGLDLKPIKQRKE